MSEQSLEDYRNDGAFTGPLDQETFRALLFNSFLHQQDRLRASRREGERLAAIAETRRIVGETADLGTALNLVAARALEMTGSTGAAIAVSAQGQMTCWATSGPTAPALGTPLGLGSGLSGECLRSRCTLRCEDADTDPRVDRDACARLGGVGSMLLVPLCRGNSAIGILEVFSTRPHAFDDADEHALELLALIAGAAVTDLAGNDPAPRVSRSVGTAVRPVASQVFPV